VESAAASGLVLVGGASGNDPIAATSRGTGELIAEAIAAGAGRVIVGVGGSASTDGGLGALEALEGLGGLGSAEVLVACDVVTPYLEAAPAFAPQKGASPAQVTVLLQRLQGLADHYCERFGVDVASMPGTGAAGGLAGGLAALGGKLVSGLDLVASRVGLDQRIVAAGLVMTGEGCLDASSWSGKVVGGVVRRALEQKVAVVVVAGSVAPGGLPVPGELEGDAPVDVVNLTECFGGARALAEPSSCIREISREFLAGR
jgi:glycerate kinase